MIAGDDIVDLVDRIDFKSSIHVRAPSPVIMLCGGKYDAKNLTPVSLREAFTHIYQKPELASYNTVMPEDFRVFAPHGQYTDILRFESEFAEIVDLVLLFSESYGSVSELGAFSMVDEIAVRLLVIMDDENYQDDSFIKLGPLRYLENKFGAEAVCVLNRKDLKIASIKDIKGLDINTFSERMIPAIAARKAQHHEHTTFNKNRAGHVIKFIVGLIQHYGALTIEEIDVLLYACEVSVDYNKLSDYLLCAISAGWVNKDRRGFVTYYCALPQMFEAISYKLLKLNPFEDKVRWRARVSDYWMREDKARFGCIQDALRSGV
ncbi:retron St85 family effector protein [Mesorhizobium sp. M1060]|uniref:retron St85 family effector protein n=1 Tax=Mesorhizobium sp. M1060 TaxID=2957052 RepID=UPI003334F4AF